MSKEKTQTPSVMCRLSRLLPSVVAALLLTPQSSLRAAEPVAPTPSPAPPAVEIPDPLLKRLAETPVSALDYGLEMMWRDLTDVAKQPINYYGRDGAFPANISITYDAKEGKIWIFIESNPGTEGGVFFPNKEKGSPAEVWCKTLINKLRVEMTGYPNNPPKWLNYFLQGSGHYSYEAHKAELDALNATLPKRVFLRAHAAAMNDAVNCTGPLIGSDISVQREATDFVE